ncbi:MAG: hypothetical protein JSW65_07185 [Candidatus Bipolaricaulota bacterium]|nr:MAG: hypothetical protein JSW65_07185 [Candidatus Bipolaricaulota bacterium]
MADVAVVIMHGAHGTSHGEQVVEHARQAATEDLIVRLRAVGAGSIHLLTDAVSFADRVSALDVVPFASAKPAPFHAGGALQEAIRSLRPDGVVYFGSGTGSLLEEEELRGLLTFAAQPDPAALLNNPFSVDFAAVSGASRLLEMDLPQGDNAFGLALADAGWNCRALPRTAATQFDIDTPTDVALLAATATGGETLRTAVRHLDLPTEAIREVLDRLVDRKACTYLLGRVNPGTWAWFESNVACRTAGILEGRGMRGYPDRPGTVLGALVDRTSPEILFDRLGRLCDAAIIDSRPFLSPEGELPPAEDRFSSDLMAPAEVTDEHWRRFTEAAMTCDVPVLLGGHNLVSGGLYLLGDACWQGYELPRRLPTEPFEPTEEPHVRP